MTLFLVKKFIGLLCMPLSMAGLLLISGLVLMWLGTHRKAAGGLLLLGTLTAMAFAATPVANQLLTPLESRHEPLKTIQEGEDVQYVVVLGGGHRSDPRMTPTMHLSPASLARLIEGVRLHRMLSESTLVFTGGAVFDAVPHARVMADAATELAEVGPVILLDTPKDTAEEMLALRGVLKGREPFLLVTSASHMPRSVALAHAAGLNPLPAPTDFLVKRTGAVPHPGEFFPSAAAMHRSERAVYEYLGLIWTKIREVPRLRLLVAEMNGV